MIGCLPSDFATDDEQLSEIIALEAENQQASQRLDRAKQESQLIQERVRYVLQSAATQQLNAMTEKTNSSINHTTTTIDHIRHNSSQS